MTKIAVFDSGLGSISIIKSIQKRTKSKIIYFADQQNFPYGKKTKSQLEKIIKNTIIMLKNRFDPDLIVIGSNTPTLVLDKITSRKIIGVLPPLKEASKISKNNNIAILATELAIKNKGLKNYITKNRLPTRIKIHKINSSQLVELVESGKFLNNQKTCRKTIKKILHEPFLKFNIDVATLSSTHLPFLLPILEKEFPNVKFLEPSETIINRIKKLTKKKKLKRNTLKIFSSKSSTHLQSHLNKLGIKNKVHSLSIQK